jgi:hypothetical protein
LTSPTNNVFAKSLINKKARLNEMEIAKSRGVAGSRVLARKLTTKA